MAKSYTLLQIAAELRIRHGPCHLCGQPIDYTLKWPDPMSFTVDHIKPRLTHPHLINDPANCAPAHGKCNSSKRDRPAVPPIGNNSRTW